MPCHYYYYLLLPLLHAITPLALFIYRWLLLPLLLLLLLTVDAMPTLHYAITPLTDHHYCHITPLLPLRHYYMPASDHISH